jgi:hypothetical protein
VKLQNTLRNGWQKIEIFNTTTADKLIEKFLGNGSLVVRKNAKYDCRAKELDGIGNLLKVNKK